MNYKTRFRLFFLAMSLFQLASNFAHPVTPTIIKDLHLHDYMFGVALAMMMTGNFLMSPFWGKLNGYISSRTTLLLCCCGFGVAQQLFAISTTEPQIICVRLFAGIFVGGIFVSMLTYIVNAARPEDQPRYLTYNATLTSVLGPFGYLIGGLLGEVSVRFTFTVQSLCLVATGILFYIACVPDAQVQEKPRFRELARTSNPLQAFLDCRYFMTFTLGLLFALNVLMNFGNTGFDQALNYYMKDQLTLTSGYNGILKAAVGFVSFAANMTLCTWIIRKTDSRKSMVVLAGLCALSALGVLVSRQLALLFFWSILVYTGYSVSLPVVQNLIATQADPRQKNLVMGFYNATKSLGSIAGSLAAGFLYAIHVRLPFGFTIVIYAAAMLTAAAAYRRRTP